MEIIIGTIDIDGIDPALFWKRPYTIPQAADKLQMPERTLRYWCKTGEIMARRFNHGNWQIPRFVVEELARLSMCRVKN